MNNTTAEIAELIPGQEYTTPAGNQVVIIGMNDLDIYYKLAGTRRYGVAVISRKVAGETWRHAPPDPRTVAEVVASQELALAFDLETTYVTRSGAKVKIFMLDRGSDNCPVLGCYEVERGVWGCSSWTREGFHDSDRRGSDLDIIGVHQPVPDVDWSTIPPRFNHVAMDQGEKWYMYEDLPVLLGDRLVWHNNDPQTRSDIDKRDVPWHIRNHDEKFDWTHTLVSRPVPARGKHPRTVAEVTEADYTEN